MGKRHESIGIKQVVRLEWMHKTANLMLAGLDSKTIRQELHEFLADRKGSGSESERGATSRTQVVNMLMNIWVSPSLELLPFRDASLAYLQEHPSMTLPIHWGVISAAYPFWFNVARQTGRLLSLQDQVTQAQVFSRLKEQYGDRETVARYARYTVRSFIAWGILRDTGNKGCYEKADRIIVPDTSLASLMLEVALHVASGAKETLGLLLHNPAFFPFQLPSITGGTVSQNNPRIDIVRYGLDDELMRLKEN